MNCSQRYGTNWQKIYKNSHSYGNSDLIHFEYKPTIRINLKEIKLGEKLKRMDFSNFNQRGLGKFCSTG